MNAVDAVRSTATGRANRGLDVQRDLAMLEHFGGPAAAYETRKGKSVSYVYYVRSPDGSPLADGDAYEWNGGYWLADGYTWADGHTWSDFWASPASVNVWVDQE